MLCVRCGAENPEQAKYCAQCQALLPQGVPTQAPRGLEVQEGRSYVLPEERFLTAHMNHMHDLLSLYLESGQGLAEIQAHLSVLQGAFQEFSQDALPRLEQLLTLEEQEDPEADFPAQVRYLENTGVDLFGRGLQEVEGSLQPTDPDRLDNGFETLQQGNDNICQSMVLVARRQEQLR